MLVSCNDRSTVHRASVLLYDPTQKEKKKGQRLCEVDSKAAESTGRITWNGMGIGGTSLVCTVAKTWNVLLTSDILAG